MQHSTTPLPTALLPTEVIEEVIDQASDDPRTLRHLTLLCKSLLTRSRIHLFATIVIRSVEQMNSSSEFFDLHRWVLPLVQKVILSAHIPGSYSKPHTPLLDIVRVHLFTRLPNLRVWEMRSNHWHHEPRLSLHRSTLLCYRIYGSRIQNLELANICIQGVSHFVQLISAFTSLQSLGCSTICLPCPKEDQPSLHVAELNPNFKLLAKPLTIRHLSVAMSVDIWLVKFLLGSSLATLASFSIGLDSSWAEGSNYGEVESYFDLFEEPLNQLSELSLLKLVISGTNCWARHNYRNSPVERIRWATRILRRIRKPSSLKDVQVQFKMESIVDLGGALYSGLPAQLEACSGLEEALLTFPSCNLQLCWPAPDLCRAGRPEFWSPTITSVFPKLNKRGLLTLPYTHPSLDPFGHENSVTCLVALKDNTQIVTASRDGTIIVWDVELGIVQQQWFAHRGPVHALGVSPNNQCLVSAGGYHGESLIIWDISNGVRKVAVLASIDGKKSIETTSIRCAWSPDGTLIASGCEDGTIHIWDAFTFQQCGLLRSDDWWPKSESNPPELLQWSADSQYLIWSSGANFNEWTVWTPLTKEPPKRFSHPIHSTDFYQSVLRFDPKCQYAVAIVGNHNSRSIGMNDGTTKNAFRSSDRPTPQYIDIRDVVTGTVVTNLEHPGVVDVWHFSPDGGSLLSVSRDSSVKIWNTDDWHEMASLKIDGRGMTRMARFSPGGEYIATICESADDVDGTMTFTLQLWRLGEASQCVAVFTEHKAEVEHLEFTPDGKFLASGDEWGIIHIRRLSSFIGH